MYRRHFLQYVPAYWQTKHTSGVLHNSGGVATVAAIQRQQGVLLPCWRKKKKNCYELFMTLPLQPYGSLCTFFSLFITAVQTCQHGGGHK